MIYVKAGHKANVCQISGNNGSSNCMAMEQVPMERQVFVRRIRLRSCQEEGISELDQMALELLSSFIIHITSDLQQIISVQKSMDTGADREAKTASPSGGWEESKRIFLSGGWEENKSQPLHGRSCSLAWIGH